MKLRNKVDGIFGSKFFQMPVSKKIPVDCQKRAHYIGALLYLLI